MASEDWSKDSGVGALLKQPALYNFFQAVRILQSLTDEVQSIIKIKYRGVNSPALKPSFVQSIEVVKKRSVTEFTIAVNSSHLLGQHSPLPSIYAEQLLREEINGNHGPTAFVNLFNHGLIKWIYEIKEKFSPLLSTGKGCNSPFFQISSSISGVRSVQTDEISSYLLEFVKNNSIHFANKRTCYSSIKLMLSALMRMKVEVEPCVGAWSFLSVPLRAVLGRNAVLGQDIGLGKRYWNNTARIRIVLHIENLSQWLALLPGGRSRSEVEKILKLLTDTSTDVELEPHLTADMVPLSYLNQSFLLGQSSWVNSRNSLPKNLRAPQILIKCVNPNDR